MKQEEVEKKLINAHERYEILHNVMIDVRGEIEFLQSICDHHDYKIVEEAECFGYNYYKECHICKKLFEVGCMKDDEIIFEKWEDFIEKYGEYEIDSIFEY